MDRRSLQRGLVRCYSAFLLITGALWRSTRTVHHLEWDGKRLDMQRSASMSETKRTRGRGLRPSQSVGRLARGRAKLQGANTLPSRHGFDDVDTQARKKVLSNYGMSTAKMKSSLKASSSVNEILHRWSYDSNRVGHQRHAC